MIKKYSNGLYWKRIIVLFLFLPTTIFLNAQDNRAWTDTTKELQYEIDTTVVDTVVSENTEEESYVPDTVEESKPEQEYFLRKEFTGGLTDTLKFRRLPDNVIKTLREDKAFWYANETFKKREKKQKEKSGFTAHPVFQTILWLIIIGGFVTFLILYLYNSNAGLFRKSTSIVGEETEMETNDIFAINYQKEIDKAVGMNNYRLAVRLMFLRLLRDLSDKNIIQYKQDSTNFDYMMQLRSTGMYPDFFRITRNYEYSWYGQFDIDKEKYFIIKKEFENFKTRLNR